jgi:hypothetical protein
MVDVLREHGPIMPKAKLEELCVEKGLRRDTFSIHLTYSPVIARYATGVYGLRGARTRRTVWSNPDMALASETRLVFVPLGIAMIQFILQTRCNGVF